MKTSKRRPLILINYELYRRKINPRLISLYHYLAHQMINKKHEVRIDRASVADDIGVSVPTLMKYLRLLVKEGFLINKKVKTRDGLDRYTVLFDPIHVEKPPKEPESEPSKPSGDAGSNLSNASVDTSASVYAPVSTGATTRSEPATTTVSIKTDEATVEPAVAMGLADPEICSDLAAINAMFPRNSVEEVNRIMEMHQEEPEYYSDDEYEEESKDFSKTDIDSPQELASHGFVPKMEGVNEEDPYMANLDEFIDDYTLRNEEFFKIAFPCLSQTYQVTNYTYAAYFLQAEDIRTKGVDRSRLFEKLDEYHEMMRSHLARAAKLEAIKPYSSYDLGYKEKFGAALNNLAGSRHLNIAEDSLTINVDPQTNHFYIKAKEQNFYELFRDSQYQNLGRALSKVCLHTCGYVTFKGPNNGDEFVFQVSENPEK